MADMVKIKFLKSTLPYAAGEDAWFNEIQAASYIKQGYAERVRNAPPYVPVLARAAMIAGANATAAAA